MTSTVIFWRQHATQFSMLSLGLVITGFSAQAAILQDSSERRIQIRNNTPYIQPAPVATDRMQMLIDQQQKNIPYSSELTIEENKRFSINNPNRHTATYGNASEQVEAAPDFNAWLNSSSYRAQQVARYQQYLSSRVGANNVPPLDQLLTTARSWEKCGFEPFQLPPEYLWSNVVQTLRLYSTLKQQGILPPSTEIRSVYRSPALNACAGGAESSKHMSAGAIDIWVPEYSDNSWELGRVQDKLCEFWQYQGESHEFGLGLYSTGAIHLDTQGYRKWGFNFAVNSNTCR